MLTLDILVIGGGLSGLIAATELQKSGYKVACVEKARGSGGRLSSKRIESEKTKQMISFDLGCASFDAKTELFNDRIESWLASGIAKVWRTHENGHRQYVATPRSSSITRHLADQLQTMHFATRITEISKRGEHWEAYTGEPERRVLYAQAKHIVFATPPQQAADLLPENHAFVAPLSQHLISPQWVLMLNIKGHLDLSESYYEFKDSIISKLVLEQSKPDRVESGDHQVWLVQASSQWTQDNLETDKAKLEHQLVAELATKAGSPVIVDDAYLHRWLYSVPQVSELSERLFMKDDNGIWFCGDYLANSDHLAGVEAAFTSAYHLAKNFQL